MGLTPRPKPVRLPEKLRQIRLSLGLSQAEMLKRRGLEDATFRCSISGYEFGTREPLLPTLLEYARVANVWMDVIVDDALDLPGRLSSSTKHEGMRRQPTNARRR